MFHFVDPILYKMAGKAPMESFKGDLFGFINILLVYVKPRCCRGVDVPCFHVRLDGSKLIRGFGRIFWEDF